MADKTEKLKIQAISKKDNTFFVIPKGDLKDKIEKEIGDSKVKGEFLPQQKIQRWDNECNVSLRLVHKEKKPRVTQEEGKVKWKGSKIEAHFYDIESEDYPEGASEFEILLLEKPDTNKVEFTVVDKDVDYFYQPEIEDSEIEGFEKLTPEELLAKKREMRPENIVGSYAVYAKTPKTNYVGGKEYKTGKIGHIPFPYIEDSNGWKVRAEDLKIEKGLLTVTIPQGFLDTAVYPVRHAAGLTFGYTSIGSSREICSSAQLAMVFTGYTGKIESVSYAVSSYSGSYPIDLKAAVYANSNSIPGALLASSVDTSVNITSTASFVTVGVELPIVNTDYFLCGFLDNVDEEYFCYDSGAKTIYIKDNWVDRTLSDPYNFGYTQANSLLSIYANYIATPTVTTQAVSSITQTTATGNGNVTADGGATVTERGVCWGTSTNPTIAGSHASAAAGGTGAFTASITGLSASTHYYVRAYATNSEGTSYGDNVDLRAGVQNLLYSKNGAPWFRVASKVGQDADELAYSKDGSPFWFIEKLPAIPPPGPWDIKLIETLGFDINLAESLSSGGTFVIEDEAAATLVENVVLEEGPQSETQIIQDFESGLGATVNMTLDTTSGADGSSQHAYCSQNNGDIEATIANVTAVGYDYLDFWVKLPASNVLLSGDASAIVFSGSAGWQWTSLYQWVDRASTDWQHVVIPLYKFTTNGNSTPTSDGTGTPWDVSDPAYLRFRFWNSGAYDWRIDQVKFVQGREFALAQTKQGHGGGYKTSVNITFDNNILAGNTVVLGLSTQNSGVVTGVTDNLGNIYVKVDGGAVGGSYGELWYSNVTLGGACTVTVTLDQDDLAFVLREYSGLHQTNPLDVYAKNIEGSYLVNHPTGTTAVTTQNAELAVIMYAGDSNCLTYSATGFSNLVSQNGYAVYSSIMMADKELSLIAIQNGIINSGAVWMKGVGLIATFRLAKEVLPATATANDETRVLGLDGVNGYAQIGGYTAVPDFSIPTTGELTISFWIKPTALDFLVTHDSDPASEGDYVDFLGKQDFPNMSEWCFRMYNKTGADRANRISFYVFNEAGGIGVGSYFQETVTPNEWIHVTAKVDTTHVYLYKNGVLKDSDPYTASITPVSTVAPLRIGTTDASTFFQGGIDDVRIYDSALATADVAAIYSAGRGGGGPVIGLTHRWKFDETSGTNAEDEIGTLDATLNGGASFSAESAINGFIIGDVDCGSSSENITLEFEGNFAISDAESISSIDNIILAQNGGELYIADESSGSSIENIILDYEGGTFSVADTESPSSAENITLQFEGDFQIANEESESSIENISISRNGGDFVLADTESLSSAENVVLIGNFVIGDLSSESSVENIVIERNGGDFSVFGIEASTSSENIVLSFEGNFSLDDLESAPLIDQISLSQGGGEFYLETLEAQSAVGAFTLIYLGNFVVDSLSAESSADNINLQRNGGDFVISELGAESSTESISLIGNFSLENIESLSSTENMSLVRNGGDFVVSELQSASAIDGISIEQMGTFLIGMVDVLSSIENIGIELNSGTFYPDNLEASSSCENISLIGELESSDSLSLSSVEEISITQNGGVWSLDNIESVSAIEAIVLTYLGTFVISDSLTSVSIDNITIQRNGGDFVIGDLECLSAIDGISIEQTGTFLVGAVEVGSYSDNVEISLRSGVLVVDGQEISSSIENISLVGNLVIDSSISEVFVEGVSLSLGGGTLDVLDILAGSSSENVVLIYVGTFASIEALVSATSIPQIVMSQGGGGLQIADMESQSSIGNISLVGDLKITEIESLSSIENISLIYQGTFESFGVTAETFIDEISVEQSGGIWDLADLIAESTSEEIRIRNTSTIGAPVVVVNIRTHKYSVSVPKTINKRVIMRKAKAVVVVVGNPLKKVYVKLNKLIINLKKDE